MQLISQTYNDLGYTDLPSRLPTQSSTLYSNNITKFLLSMTTEEKCFGVDLKDEVVRGSIVTYKGDIVPTAPRPAPPPPPVRPPVTDTKETETVALTPWQKTSRDVATVTGVMGLALALGKATGPIFMGNVFTFALAGLIGYRTVWGVVPALHSPLMSVTNAISGEWSKREILNSANEIPGMVGVGGFFIMGGGILPHTLPQLLGSLSVLLAFVNVSGGFLITKRMLDMFKRMF
jgi:NAD(P) transhydrogenase